MSIYMEMCNPHSRWGYFLARAQSLLARWVKPFVVLTLTTLLVAVSASPQSPGGTSAPSAHPSAKAPEASPSRPDKSRAQIAYQAGRRAEQAGDWNVAYTSYSEATAYAPTDKEYSLLREHARFQLVQGLADLGERRLLAGDSAGAREQLVHALEIDPNYAIARERLAELPADSPNATPEKGPRRAGLPRLHPKPGTRDFDYRGTTRSAYEELGRQFGVTIAFDGDLTDRSIRFRAPNVDFETSLMVLARQTRTFTRVVDAHTVFVVEDSALKERDYMPEVEKQILLPASVTSDEMNETVRMIREMTGITRTQLNTATRTLTVRSTEQNVALAQTLLEQIEQPHGELILDIEILELDRTAANQLGITPPTSSSVFMLTLPEIRQLQAAQNNGTLIQILQSIFGNSAVSSASGSALPALIAFGGGKTIFLATMPSATANFGTALSTVHSAQRVLLRAQDGKPATFFVGDRFPIDLGLLSSDLSSTSSALSSALGSALASGLTLPSTNYASGNGPISVAIADVNKDGHPDLVVANETDGTLSIFLGNGDGTFEAQTVIQLPGVTSGTSTTATKPSAVVTGDFNNDGDIDIAVTDIANNRVLILL